MSSDFFKEFKNKKKKLRILLLGAYTPKASEDRLIRFKNFLIENSYINAKLVKDFPDQPSFHNKTPVHIVTKSKFLIEKWADVLLFVFSKGANNEGVAIEFEFCCSKVIGKLGFSVIFVEKGLALSSMILGSIQIQEIKTD